MGKPISGLVTSRVVLSDPADNPVNNEATAILQPGAYGGVIGLGPIAWIITNSGFIDPNPSANAPGIY